MEKVKFIVAADVHHHIKNYNSNKLRKKFIDLISKDFSNSLDFCTITGDFYNQGKGDSKQIADYLSQIAHGLGLKKEDIYIVPGNHDLKRSKIRTRLLQNILSSSDPTEEFNTVDTDTYNSLNSDFEPYKALYKDFYGTEINDFTHTTIEKEKYRLVLLNSCYTSGQSDEEGKLLLGQNKFIENIDYSVDEKLSIAFGHHALDCLSEKEEQKTLLNFDEKNIDLYISGHTHKPGYNFKFAKTYIIPTFVTGALVSDSWAKSTFIYCEVDLKKNTGKIKYFSYNEEGEFWFEDNSIGKLVADNLEFDLKCTPLISEEEISEDDFKVFVLQFNEIFTENKAYTESIVAKDVIEKFKNMKCNKTTRKSFDKLSQYFPIIDDLFSGTTIISFDSKYIIPTTVIDYYQSVLPTSSTGEEIIEKMIERIKEDYKDSLSITNNRISLYLKILIFWSINECDIFNEELKGK